MAYPPLLDGDYSLAALIVWLTLLTPSAFYSQREYQWAYVTVILHTILITEPFRNARCFGTLTLLPMLVPFGARTGSQGCRSVPLHRHARHDLVTDPVDALRSLGWYTAPFDPRKDVVEPHGGRSRGRLRRPSPGVAHGPRTRQRVDVLPMQVTPRFARSGALPQSCTPP
jgi:hypothetical protein